METKAMKDTVYGRLKSQSDAHYVDVELLVVESIRDLHPDKHLTSVSGKSCPLIRYAEAGHATSRLDTEGNRFLAKRGYIAPTNTLKGTKGTLDLSVEFGLYHYKYQGTDFFIYCFQSRCDTPIFYVLTDKQEDDEATHCKFTDELLMAAAEWDNKILEQIEIFDDGRWEKSHELWKTVHGASWSDVILDPTAKQRLVDDVNGFYNSRAIYEEYTVPWKRGIILHGPPGCGKTISIKALMNDLSKREPPVPSLYVKSFHNMCGPQMAIRQVFTKARAAAPCLLIFEDLDSLVDDYVRSYFLNEVDGLESNDGILMIGSTNHLERLDPGISKRPSRFDRKYGFKLPSEAERASYCDYWREKLQKHKQLDFDSEMCTIIAKLTDGFSFAYLKELFVQTLLALAGGYDEDDGIDTDVVSGQPEEFVITEPIEIHKVKDGSLIADKDIEPKYEAKSNAKPAKREVPDVVVPDHLAENKLLQLLRKQVLVLFKDMDTSQDEEVIGRPKVPSKYIFQDTYYSD